MKKYPFLLLMPFFAVILSCTNNDDMNPIAVDWESSVSLNGTWEMIGTYQSDGGAQYYTAISNGEILRFSSQGTFTTTKYPNCKDGTYSIEDKELTLTYNCDSFNERYSDLQGKFTFIIRQESNFLLLSPKSNFCIEGCSSKYKKVSN